MICDANLGIKMRVRGKAKELPSINVTGFFILLLAFVG
jgi:hypothetical protein